ncbi:MAG: MlaA family lipoprotein [Planctomycetota bacterium]
MLIRKVDTVFKSYIVMPKVWAVIILALLTAGCAVSEKTQSSDNIALDSDTAVMEDVDDEFDLFEDELAEKKIEVSDPLKGLNQLMFNLNDTIYFWILKPVTTVYRDIAPEPVRIGIDNFFHNLTTPIRFVNCVVQGKGDAAGTEFYRFAINTTIGVLGFGDPAQDKYGLKSVEEDLGQTLGVHGVGNGFYLVLPLLGPSTARDAAGKVGDMFLNPVFYVDPTEAAIGISTVKFTNETSFRIGEYEDFKAAALDPYVAMREAYIQYRSKQIQE